MGEVTTTPSHNIESIRTHIYELTTFRLPRLAGSAFVLSPMWIRISVPMRVQAILRNTGELQD